MAFQKIKHKIIINKYRNKFELNLEITIVNLQSPLIVFAYKANRFYKKDRRKKSNNALIRKFFELFLINSQSQLRKTLKGDLKNDFNNINNNC